MKAVSEFRQDKSNFMMWFSLYAVISFLAVCLLFGLYIFKSFNNPVSVEQTAMDNYYNNQEVHK